MPRGAYSIAAERVIGGEGDGVEDAVDTTPATAQFLGERGEVLGIVDVELEHIHRLRQTGRRTLGHPAYPAEGGQQHLGALLLQTRGKPVAAHALGRLRIFTGFGVAAHDQHAPARLHLGLH